MRHLLIRWLLLILLLPLGLPFGLRGQSIAQDSSLEHAKELWEMAIAAKGGREKLHQVNNLVFIGEGQTSITFWAFPDKYFSWSDARPSAFGIGVTIDNYETGFGYSTAFSNPPQVKMEKDIRQRKTGRSHLLICQIESLLETKWVQPEILGATKRRVGGKQVDLVNVQITWYNELFKFGVFLDEKTHLPVRIGRYGTFKPNEFYFVTDMRNYIDVEGIKMPTELSWFQSSDWTHPRYEINVDYDPQFFNRVPDLNAGPFQWRKAGSKTLPMQSVVIEKPKPLSNKEIAQYIQDLVSQNDDVSLSARRELVTAGRQSLPALIDALKSSNRLLSFRAAVLILEIDKENRSVMDTLPSYLLDPKLGEEERQDAAFGLLRNDQGIAQLIDLLLHPDPFVRRYVIFAFDELTERREIPKLVEDAIPALRKLTQDKDEIVRKMANEVLEQIELRLKRK